MSTKILLENNISVVVISLGLLFYFNPINFEKNDSTSLVNTAIIHTAVADSNQVVLNTDGSLPSSTQKGLPITLNIPIINVNASIIYVGLDSSGAMEAPVGPGDVAWYRDGTKPGDMGSAVIAGHFGWKNNIPAAFDDLHTLKVGDKISVIDDRGVSHNFIVTKTEIFDLNSDASTVFSSSDGISHLNLITCEGVWDSVTRNYSKRLVVFTDRE